MRTQVPANEQGERQTALYQMLARLREETYEKICEYRLDQRDESETAPADEMDVARSSADIETHASLIARAEERLRFIDEAMGRIEQGVYGICAGCGDEIGVQRLSAVPFAVLCIDCQSKTNRSRKWGEGTAVRPYDRQWSMPEEMEVAGDRNYAKAGPEDDLSIHFDEPFGPEQGEAPVKRKRGRPRKHPLS